MSSWTCQRQSNGVVCRHVNPPRKRNCEQCGKRRPPRKRPAHLAVLETTTYEECVARFGERCGICGSRPKPGKKLHRDHEHKDGGEIRGLLCFRDNSALRSYMTIDWLRNALAYLEAYEARKNADLSNGGAEN